MLECSPTIVEMSRSIMNIMEVPLDVDSHGLWATVIELDSLQQLWSSSAMMRVHGKVDPRLFHIILLSPSETELWRFR